MNQRERDYQKTKQELRDALARLVAGEVTCPELMKRKEAGKTININPNTVQKEADRANGALARHGDVLEQIEDIVSKIKLGLSITENVLSKIKRGETVEPVNDGVNEAPLTVQQVKESSVHIRALERLETSRNKRKKAEARVAEQKSELERKNRELNDEIATRDNMFAALWDAIPTYLVEERMVAMAKLTEVVELHDAKREKEREEKKQET
ncbi:hypothetical protein [Vibrio parahaemolyticus]|uniref:hypothetical protein n=1 Tax=Vibrio parahaemolyticus TaxID=670 RepID=UPI003298A1F6